jgi:hypothetical protein
MFSTKLNDISTTYPIILGTMLVPKSSRWPVMLIGYFNNDPTQPIVQTYNPNSSPDHNQDIAFLTMDEIDYAIDKYGKKFHIPGTVPQNKEVLAQLQHSNTQVTDSQIHPFNTTTNNLAPAADPTNPNITTALHSDQVRALEEENLRHHKALGDIAHHLANPTKE